MKSYILATSLLACLMLPGFIRGAYGQVQQPPNSPSLVDAVNAAATQALGKPPVAATPPATAPATQPVAPPVAAQPAVAPPIGAPGSKPPQVGFDEVYRRGDSVTYTGDERQAGVGIPELNGLISQVAAIPPNDKDKWHIDVIGERTSPKTLGLLEEWKKDKILRSYAMPDNAKDSWAHWHYYDYNDKFQKWRWTPSPSNPKAVRITSYPTILVMPPRTGVYGNPENVVLQYVYEGDPNKLMLAINSHIRTYMAALKAKGWQQSNPTEAALDDGATPVPGGIGQAAWPPVPKLPNEEEEQAENDKHPVRDLLGGRKAEIVIIRDKDQRQRNDEEEAIDKAVGELQPKTGEQYTEKVIDIRDPRAKAFNVEPGETPVVLLVEGKRVIEKLSAQPDAEGGRGLLWLIDWYTGGWIGDAIWFVIKFMFFVLVIFFLIFMFIFFQNRQAQIITTQQPSGLTAADIEALLDAREAKKAQAKAKVAAE